MHRDLKPENILIDKEQNNILKLIDFGTSVTYERGQKLTGVHGTVYYIAPEVIDEKQYDERCDVWSAGVMLYILLSGRPPFDGDDDQAIIKSVKQAKLDFDDAIWTQISPMAKVLIQKMLTKDYTKRIYASEALNDPWFKNAKSTKVDPAIVK